MSTAVWALLLEQTHPRLASDVFYVAGDRVVSDPLCKPFSMGRNLFCVHSKKHLDDDPSQKEAKQRTNRKTLSEMVKELNAVSLQLCSHATARASSRVSDCNMPPTGYGHVSGSVFSSFIAINSLSAELVLR